MIRRNWFSLLLLTIVSTAWCLVVVAETNGQQATVQVRCYLENGSVSESSGVVVKAIGNECEVLSSAHSGPLESGSVEIVFYDGRRAWATKSQVNRQRDLVLYSVPTKADGWRRLGPEVSNGQQVIGIGYGSDRRLARLDGIVISRRRLGPTENRSAGRNVETIGLSYKCQKGDSGGPVINLDGELVGIMLAGPTTQAVSATQIREVLDACWGRKCGPQAIPSVVPDSPQSTQIDLDQLAALVAARLPAPIHGAPGPPGESIVGPPGPPGKSADVVIEIEGRNGEIVGLIRPDESGRIRLPPIKVVVDGISKTVPLGGVLDLYHGEPE